MRNYSRETFKTASIMENVICFFYLSSHGTAVSLLYPSSKSFAEPLQSTPLGLLWPRVHGSLWAPCYSTTFYGGWRHSNGWIYCSVITENLPVFPPLYYLSVNWNLIKEKGTKTRTTEMLVRIIESKDQATAKVLDHTGHSSKAPGLLCQCVSVFKS